MKNIVSTRKEKTNTAKNNSNKETQCLKITKKRNEKKIKQKQ